jgi:hypothetical protein
MSVFVYVFILLQRSSHAAAAVTAVGAQLVPLT